VSLLRRLFGGGGEERDGDDRRTTEPPATDAELQTAELEHEREIMRAESERLDELRQRQLRYSDHAWTPPAQGGERRADDEDAARD